MFVYTCIIRNQTYSDRIASKAHRGEGGVRWASDESLFDDLSTVRFYSISILNIFRWINGSINEKPIKPAKSNFVFPSPQFSLHAKGGTIDNIGPSRPQRPPLRAFPPRPTTGAPSSRLSVSLDFPLHALKRKERATWQASRRWRRWISIQRISWTAIWSSLSLIFRSVFFTIASA